MTDRVIIAPRIETERLILREFQREDFDAFASMVANPDVGEFIGGTVSDRAAAWEKFLRAPGFWALLGYGMWIAEEKESGRIAGNIGFGQFCRAMDPPLPDVPEAAWVLDSWAHGKGYAGEAMAAALGWADGHIETNGYVCIIAPENMPSRKLAEKLGFRETRRTPYKGDETIVLERPAA